MAQLTGSTVPAPTLLDINNSSMVINNIKMFAKKFNLYLRVNDLNGKLEKLKVAILLSVIGDEAYELLESLNSTSNGMTVDGIFKALLNYYEPKFNIIIEQFMFFQRKQEEFKSFDKFLKDIKTLSKRCDFGSLEDSIVKIHAVLEVCDRSFQERLLRAPDIIR